MTNLEFQGTLFRCTRDLANGIAGEWITAGGLNTDADIRGFFASSTDESLADDCINGWGLDAEWLGERDIDRSDIVAAMGRTRAEYAM